MRCDLCGEELEGSDVPSLASDTLPRDLRWWHIVGDKKRGIAPILPISRSTLWKRVQDGKFPKPYKHSPRVTVWRREDVIPFLKSRTNQSSYLEADHIRPFSWGSVLCAQCHSDLRASPSAVATPKKKREPPQRG